MQEKDVLLAGHLPERVDQLVRDPAFGARAPIRCTVAIGNSTKVSVISRSR